MSDPTNPLSTELPKRTRSPRGQTGRTRKKTKQEPATAPRPAPDDRAGWKQHWEALGQPWRTEPEIEQERQAVLAEHRSIPADWKQGLFPFQGVNLSRADIEWLLATHEDGLGPVDWQDDRQRDRKGLDLRGASLQRVDLSYLPLACARGD